jgi:2-polyprenyl-3-methyl-5-hydroxy-6-metoxy-1,4-benzoquinol methylase
MSNHVANIYKDGTYAGHNPGCGESNCPWKASQVLAMIRKSNLAPKTITEVGCGSGGILEWLHANMDPSIEFTGIEPMPEAYAKSVLKTKERLSIINATADAVTSQADLLLLLDVFEHVEDYLGFLRSLLRLGKNFIFHIPLDMNAQMVLRDEPIMRVRRDVGHLHYFSKNSAIATLQDSGYEITDWFYSDMKGCVFRNWRTKLLWMPRRALMALAPDFSVRLLGGISLTVLAQPKAEA